MRIYNNYNQGSGGSRPGFWGEQSNKGAPKSLNLFKYPSFSEKIVGYHTKVVTFSRPRKWLFMLVELCDLSGNHRSLKSPFINKSQSLKVQKDWSYFSQATHN